MDIKICGLSTLDAVHAARMGGASHLGFIFFPKSPRNVGLEQAAELAKQAGNAKTVAVTVNADDDFLDNIVTTMSPSMLQLHGSETAERVEDIKARYGLPVIKALAISRKDDIARVMFYDDIAETLLLDAKPPKDSELPGGNGVSFDWSLLDNLKTCSPVLLSGGLDIDNVGHAKTIVAQTKNSVVGLDVSSGVESAPGVKDIAKIEAFLSACGGQQA